MGWTCNLVHSNDVCADSNQSSSYACRHPLYPAVSVEIEVGHSLGSLRPVGPPQPMLPTEEMQRFALPQGPRGCALGAHCTHVLHKLRVSSAVCSYRGVVHFTRPLHMQIHPVPRIGVAHALSQATSLLQHGHCHCVQKSAIKRATPFAALPCILQRIHYQNTRTMSVQARSSRFVCMGSVRSSEKVRVQSNACYGG
jgi:hypothetical protein